MAVSASTIRNVALLSHSGAGKTSLAETILFNAKVINRLGRVEDGNTVSDHEPEENKRSASVQTSLLRFTEGDNKVNLLDTPGYDEFLGEAIAAVRVVESAMILIAAPTGVDVGTERSWDLARARDLPVAIVLNKMDRENASFERNVQEIQSIFGSQCVPFQLPIGEALDFTGLVSVIDPPADIPAGVVGDFDSARERLIEAVAESDDTLADKYLEGEEITAEEVTAGAREAIRNGDLTPILVTSATQNIGVEELVQVMRDFLPSPADLPGTSGDDDIAADPSGPVAALVFKTTSDPFVGKLSMFRVFRGTAVSNGEVYNNNKGESERLGQLYVPQGKNQDNVAEVVAGDIGAIGKLNATLTGDTLCANDSRVTLPGIEFPSGYYSLAVVPATQADLDKMSTSLARIVEDDPSLQFTRNPETSESLLTGLGEVQIEVALDRISRKFGANLNVKLPVVPYRETVTQITNSEYRHKKQTGGSGQYGHVLLRIEPMTRDEGFEFANEVTGGRVPRELIPAVEKGVVNTLKEGVLAGFPVVDLKAIIYDGSTHPVDGKPIAFEIAGSQALRQGMQKASPVLLEPILRLYVTVPETYTGDIISDMNSKRGRILGMSPETRYTVIEAEVPQAEVQRYSQDLRSMTGGRGSYRFEFDHYEQVPQNIEQRVIETAKQAKAGATA
ncbi:MAG: elongation factor G [Chloroflexi bacterium]|nr:elongation factor G [Chloroflexota bacterium]